MRGSFLGEVGFDVMTLANNHMIDGGYDALVDTIELLRGQGIATTGAGSDIAEATVPAILERDGIRVAFLGFCTRLPGRLRGARDAARGSRRCACAPTTGTRTPTSGSRASTR